MLSIICVSFILLPFICYHHHSISFLYLAVSLLGCFVNGQRSSNGGDCSRGGGGEDLIPFSDIFSPSCSFVEPINSTSGLSCNYYYSKRDMLGDIFYGTNDFLDVKDLMHKEDVLEYYSKETIMGSFKRRRSGWFSLLPVLLRVL
jgi:hypothetical protein